jgi:hypothetical protein
MGHMRRGWQLIAGCLVMAACSGGSTPPALSPPALTPPPASPVPPTAVPFEPPRAERPTVEVRAVEMDEPVDGVWIPGQYEERYRFTTDRARRITVRLEPVDGRGPLRFGIRLSGEDGRIVPRIEAPVGQPLLRDEWDLPGPGAYVIQLFGPDMRERAFTLWVSGVPAAEVGGGDIAYGETRSGAIAVRGQRDRWTLAGSAGDRVLISLVSDGADPHVAVYDAAGQLLAEDDDSAGGRNAAVEVVLPDGGRAVIVARMAGDDQTGAYQIRAEKRASEERVE